MSLLLAATSQTSPYRARVKNKLRDDGGYLLMVCFFSPLKDISSHTKTPPSSELQDDIVTCIDPADTCIEEGLITSPWLLLSLTMYSLCFDPMHYSRTDQTHTLGVCVEFTTQLVEHVVHNLGPCSIVLSNAYLVLTCCSATHRDISSSTCIDRCFRISYSHPFFPMLFGPHQA